MVQTIEQTGKAWKLFKVFGVMLLIFGIHIVVGMWIAGIESPAVSGVMFAVIVCGFAAFVIGRVGAWWSNG